MHICIYAYKFVFIYIYKFVFIAYQKEKICIHIKAWKPKCRYININLEPTISESKYNSLFGYKVNQSMKILTIWKMWCAK